MNFKKLDCKYNQNILNRLLKISIPTLSGRIIGNIGFFFEPIILTNLLIYKGLDSSLIRLSYGYFQGYVIAILTIPSFFLMALSSNTIPVISKYKTHKEFNKIKKTINKVLLTVLFCGTIFIIFLSIYGKNLMYILYKTTSGYNYLKMLLPFFIIFYIENPMLSILQSLDMEKKVFKITTCGIIIKYISLILLILFNKGFNSLIYSEIINIIFVISLSVYYLKKYFSCSSLEITSILLRTTTWYKSASLCECFFNSLLIFVTIELNVLFLLFPV